MMMMMMMMSNNNKSLTHKQRETAVACSEKSAKLMPLSVGDAPNGEGCPRETTNCCCCRRPCSVLCCSSTKASTTSICPLPLVAFVVNSTTLLPLRCFLNNLVVACFNCFIMMPTAESLSPPPPPATHPLDIIDTDLYDVDAKRDFSGSLTFLLLLVLWNGMHRAEESCVAFNAISVKTVCYNNPFCCFFFSICYCKASFKLHFFPSSRPYKLRHTSHKLP